MGVADVNPGERAALVVYRLTQGARMSTADIAGLCEVSVRTARRDVCSIERVLPIRRDEQGRIFLMGEERRVW